MVYLSRTLDDVISNRLSALGGVLIEGPRACGKTRTGLELSASSVRLDQSPGLVEVAAISPQTVLTGATPRFIDEWQLAPALWNAMRHTIDDRQLRGQFILSGSATPADDITRHSGVGRIARLRMRPMSLAESVRSSSEISLRALMSGESESVSARSPLSYEDMAVEAVKGGWPSLIGSATLDALVFNRSYCEELTRTAVQTATGIRHEPESLRRLLSALARNTATEVTLQTLAADVAGDGPPVDPKTIRTYLDGFSRVFATEDLPAWSVHLRSRSRLRSASKRHFSDPALACAALGIGPERLALDPEYFGFVFESMVIRDLRIYAEAIDGRVYHYRDNTGLEVDAILELPDGRWSALEVKLGSHGIPAAERSLLMLRDERVDSAKVGNPSFLAIVTATEYGYTLPSGVHVIPLGSLGP